jgi:uncharacterized protein
MPRVWMQPQEWRILRSILEKHLPGRRVWAYGSRARRERVRRYSDLDLAVSGAKLTGTKGWELEEALDESLLPYKVDLTFIDDLSEDFRRRIEPDFVLLQDGGEERDSAPAR